MKTLSKENADRVAQHLVMASMLIDSDVALAHRHAQAAGRRAGRVSVVRETLAITAYAVEDYTLALRELRTYRRLSGSNEQLPLMVDCERGLGRPEKALELGRSVDRAELSVPTRVELAIAMSGARLDLGQPEQALAELEIPQLDASTAYRYSPGLFDAYAVVLAELGRDDEAAEWGRRADVAAEAIAGAEGEFDDIVEIVEEELSADEMHAVDEDAVLERVDAAAAEHDADVAGTVGSDVASDDDGDGRHDDDSGHDVSDVGGNGDDDGVGNGNHEDSDGGEDAEGREGVR
ncbi:hypothetical protein OVN20_11365 [Microcella daejeonensis]|uniref:hypothetical protein n=1 Tax=Microcella daejeonensis TaxID=2994971 RepID=UPI00226DE335|nr:hypothetical protein [Microcella daejeonensis]WAB83638.1 hypothetical protein OVN20_11365 [Microcella daejeonensis]